MPAIPLPFQYQLRGGAVERLDGARLAQALENRDRELEDYLARVSGVWQDWVPTMTAGAAITLSTAIGRYTRIGNMVMGDFTVVANSAGTPNTIISISRPLPQRTMPAGIIRSLGTAYASVGATGQMMIHVVGSTGGDSSFNFIRADIAGIANYYGIDPAITVGVGNQISGSFMYEAAS
jgi:hypothetical protein